MSKRLVLAAVLAALASPALAGKPASAKPTRVLIVVMDQMRPEYAQQFDMTNVLWLENHGIDYNKAYVGDMASETVVSHNVMVSGLFPKHMGWSDEAFRDVDNVTGYGDPAYGANGIVTSGDLGTAEYTSLIERLNYPKLGDYLHAKFPNSIVACVGEKAYQVESMAASNADYWVRMGGKNSANPTLTGLPGKYRGPSGNVPSYISSDPRFFISSGNSWDKYGTADAWPSWLYPEDGRMAIGTFPGHESGDSWVADATTSIMQHENWSGIFVNFGAIDKIGHMWGGGLVDNATWAPDNILRTVHIAWVAKHADDQLGKLMAEVKAEDQARGTNTLIVLDADHGQTVAQNFNGENAPDAGSATNWYAGKWLPGYGSDVHVPNVSPGSAALKPLMDTGNVAFSYQSTAIETWLVNHTWTDEVAAANVMKALPGVIATYAKSCDGNHYVLTSASRSMTWSEWLWWMQHGQELVNTMAFSGSADVVGLLADKTSYGVYGDHGGAQMDVQRIPMVFYSSGMKHLVRGTPFRLVDIMPTVLRTMGIPPTAPMDGTAYNLSSN